MEKRYIGSLGTTSPTGNTINGYCILWNKPSVVNGRKEFFKRGSLKESPEGTSLYLQHNEQRILANSKAGTLKLTEDEVGLRYQANLPESAKDIREAIKRKDIQGVSVGFLSLKDELSSNSRGISKAYLEELSLTDKPAHKTTIDIRKQTNKKRHWRSLLWDY